MTRARVMLGAAARCLGTLMMFFSGIAVAGRGMGAGVGPPTQEWTGDLSVDTPTQLIAGDVLPVDLYSLDAPVGARAEVVLVGAFETHTVSVPLMDGRAAVVFGSDLTDHAGVVSIRAAVGQSRAGADVLITPRNAVSPVVPLVGPRTIVANNADRTMVVVLPTDRFGNAVAAGTTVDFDFERVDASPVSLLQDQVAAGIAAVDVRSGAEIGRVAVEARVGQTNGPLNFFDEVAGTPADFGLAAVAVPAVADGFSLFEVETTELRDVHGNLLPDGVVATFRTTGPSGVSETTGTVQNGVARVTLEAPDRPGIVDVVARVSGVEAEPLSLSFGVAVSELTVGAQIERGPPAKVSVEIGPVVLSSGGYVPDGTPFVLQLEVVPPVDPMASAILAVRHGAVRSGTSRVEIDVAGDLLIGRQLYARVEVLGVGTRQLAEIR